MQSLPLRTRAALLGGACLLAAALLFSAVASAATTTTITFQEPEKGSTFTYVDVAPTAPKKHGFPTKISPGDQFVSTNPLTEDGKTIGKLRARCTATSAVGKLSAGAFAQAHFICEGVFSLPDGSIYASASIVKTGTEGVVSGGTGKYIGARGTIVSKEAKGGNDTTITLIGE